VPKELPLKQLLNRLIFQPIRFSYLMKQFLGFIEILVNPKAERLFDH
jgi:hypothetical protein